MFKTNKRVILSMCSVYSHDLSCTSTFSTRSLDAEVVASICNQPIAIWALDGPATFKLAATHILCLILKQLRLQPAHSTEILTIDLTSSSSA
jgi:hypothetical protein